MQPAGLFRQRNDTRSCSPVWRSNDTRPCSLFLRGDDMLLPGLLRWYVCSWFLTQGEHSPEFIQHPDNPGKNACSHARKYVQSSARDILFVSLQHSSFADTGRVSEIVPASTAVIIHASSAAEAPGTAGTTSKTWNRKGLEAMHNQGTTINALPPQGHF